MLKIQATALRQGGPLGMRLTSSDGAEIALRPTRYQFRAATRRGHGRDWDANWLVVRGDVTMADGKGWSFEDPCLTTWEARALGRWLRDVLAGTVAPSPFDGGGDEQLLVFTEPNLALSLGDRNAKRVRLRVHLSLESLPPWLQGTSRPEIFAFFVVLEVAHEDLARAAEEWDRDLARFPER